MWGMLLLPVFDDLGINSDPLKKGSLLKPPGPVIVYKLFLFASGRRKETDRPNKALNSRFSSLLPLPSICLDVDSTSFIEHLFPKIYLKITPHQTSDHHLFHPLLSFPKKIACRQ
ncbi:hypothetical protein EYC84_002693 [Monilinia fructicola]|uniref:Uncharacterized protein n=1 Tax=Monilinia fructicola TaxID=38448 RepID=A0A5M9JLQ8_MONFR|nr:hypothetical protein EYC84_002693 [Monilinia fructicola]